MDWDKFNLRKLSSYNLRFFFFAGMEVLRKLKADKRSEAGLSDIKEDTLTVSKTMRAASPPASAADILEATNNRRNNRPSKISN